MKRDFSKKMKNPKTFIKLSSHVIPNEYASAFIPIYNDIRIRGFIPNKTQRSWVNKRDSIYFRYTRRVRMPV